MASDVQTPAEPGVVNIIKGILEDVHELFQQQVALVRAEIRSDWNQTKQAASPLLLGIAPLGIGTFLLGFMLVHLLHWLASPVTQDLASIPLWGCYGIVGGLFAALGAGLILCGIRKFQAFNPLPDQSVQALEENVKWLVNRK